MKTEWKGKLLGELRAMGKDFISGVPLILVLWFGFAGTKMFFNFMQELIPYKGSYADAIHFVIGITLVILAGILPRKLKKMRLFGRIVKFLPSEILDAQVYALKQGDIYLVGILGKEDTITENGKDIPVVLFMQVTGGPGNLGGLIAHSLVYKESLIQTPHTLKEYIRLGITLSA